MVMVIEGGTQLANESYLHGANVETRRFIHERFQAHTPILLDAGVAFQQKIQAIEANYAMETAPIRLAIAAERQITGMWTEDVIQDLVSIAQLQNPPDVMIPYLMADPIVRRAYQLQQCEGYGERYVDEEPGNIGITHTLYRQMTDGMVIFDDDDEELENPGWRATTWSSDEENKLAFKPKCSIAYTLRNLREKFLEGGEDPTSEMNVRLT